MSGAALPVVYIDLQMARRTFRYHTREKGEQCLRKLLKNQHFGNRVVKTYVS